MRLGLIAVVLLMGCQKASGDKHEASVDQPTPSRRHTPSADTGVELSVLIYNIEGLQWPARAGRAKYLRLIGDNLRRLRESGNAPDIVLFQETFSSAAKQAVKKSGYPAIVSGPSRATPSTYSFDGKLPGRTNRAKGELGIKLVSSGLVIASRYPITDVVYDAYSRNSCAGFDCLANKGVMLARVSVPGLPEPVDIANTHMNSNGAAKVSLQRRLASHRAQAQELAMFLRNRRAPERGMILAGDFNMAKSPERFTFFRSLIPMTMVHEYCLQRSSCDVRASWDGDAPWMDTEDLQFFSSGRRIGIVPVKVRAMFDGSPTSPKLSDHDGLEVTYRLSVRY